MNCLVCNRTHNNVVVDLGSLYQSNFINFPEDTEMFTKHPVQLAECPGCGFVQMVEMIPPDNMYREYWYKSSLNKSMVADLKDVYEDSLVKLGYTPNVIIDIGANDGTLLGFYSKNNNVTIGFDPANNLSSVAETKCNKFINDYFSAKYCQEYFGKTDIITSIAMFYDVPNPHEFVEDIKKFLSPEGIWIVQMTGLTEMLEVNAFDNICHEHIAYYSIVSLMRLLRQHDMRIFYISKNEVNGRSGRFYICRNRSVRKTHDSVNRWLIRERYVTLTTPIHKLQSVITETCRQTLEMMDGKNVMAVGASTKGNTFLQVAGITDSQIKYCAEVSTDKFGKFTLGSNLEIISEQEGVYKYPDALLILPWHFADNIVNKLRFIYLGADFIIPLPVPHYIEFFG